VPFCVQDSAVNIEEVEEALAVVRQRREEGNPELDFLHKVDDEQNRGCQYLVLHPCQFTVIIIHGSLLLRGRCCSRVSGI